MGDNMCSYFAQDDLLRYGLSKNVQRPLRRLFDPLVHGLDPNFKLTQFIELKARNSNAPQEFLNKLLKYLQQDKNGHGEQSNHMHTTMAKKCFEMTISVVPIKNHSELSLVQTTDNLYPLVDDPFFMGKIACSSVLSNLYAMGVIICDNMLMLLSVSTNMTEKERDVVIPLLMKGFKETAFEAGTTVTGGQTVINPWCTIGGVATTVCQQNEFITQNRAIVGDVLVLTKPIGTQVAINVYHWLGQRNKWNRIKSIVTEEDVRKAYQCSLDSMSRLNKTAAKLMHKYRAHGGTNVTGFGLLGHAQILAKHQENEVTFVIHNLPVIAKMASVAKAFDKMFPLLQGYSPETSGGLLICLPRDRAAMYCKDIAHVEGYQAWIIGVVEKGNRTARINDKFRVLEIPVKEKDGQLS